jgi:hypothetical protein
VKATNGSVFSGDGVSQVIFDIPAMSGGYYLDSAATRLSFNLLMQDATGTATAMDASRGVWLDRGPQSLINRFQLYDASGHLLEDIQNYHLLYGLVKVCTGNPAAIKQRGTFTKECTQVQYSAHAINTQLTNQNSPDPSGGGLVYISGGTAGVLSHTSEGPYVGTTTDKLPLTFHLCLEVVQKSTFL